MATTAKIAKELKSRKKRLDAIAHIDPVKLHATGTSYGERRT